MSNDGVMSFSRRDQHLGAARWPDLTSPVTLLIPIGSCEQHGPHLPLDTDTQIAEEIAARSAARSQNCVVAPAISITASGEHQGFPGTLSIGNEALTLCIVELCRSAEWAHRIILVNGHGGNFAAVTSSCATLHNEGRNVTAWWPQGSPNDLHAGRIETSVMLSIAPSEVAMADMTSGPIPTIGDLLALGVQPLSPTGVLGDPTGATAAEGEQWLSVWVDDLAHIISDDS